MEWLRAPLSRLTPMTSPRWPTRLLAALTAGVMIMLTGCGTGGADSGAYGQRITGTSVSTGAPVLTVGDSWDELGSPGTDQGVRVYTIERAAGEDVTVSVSAPPQADQNDGLELELTDASGTRCQSTSATSYVSSREPLMSASVGSTVRAGDQCLESTRLVLSVRRAGKGTSNVQVRIRLFTVPNVENKEFPILDYQGQLSPLSVGASTPGTPGRWLNDAGDLSPEQTVSGELGTAALHTYKIPLEWGQGMQVQLVFPDPPPTVQEQMKDAGLRGGLQVVNPAGKMDAYSSISLSPGGATNLNLEPMFYASSLLANVPGYYTLIVSVTSTKETAAVLPYQLIASPYGAVNNGLGPQVVFATPSSGPSEAVLWIMLVAGVLLIIAGMAQVTLSRQRH